MFLFKTAGVRHAGRRALDPLVVIRNEGQGRALCQFGKQEERPLPKEADLYDLLAENIDL